MVDASCETIHADILPNCARMVETLQAYLIGCLFSTHWMSETQLSQCMKWIGQKRRTVMSWYQLPIRALGTNTHVMDKCALAIGAPMGGASNTLMRSQSHNCVRLWALFYCAKFVTLSRQFVIRNTFVHVGKQNNNLPIR